MRSRESDPRAGSRGQLWRTDGRQVGEMPAIKMFTSSRCLPERDEIEVAA